MGFNIPPAFLSSCSTVTYLCVLLCRAQLQGQFLMSLETSEGLLEEMGTQALATRSYCPSAEISKKIDNVSLTDVSNVSHSLIFTSCQKLLAKDKYFCDLINILMLISRLPGNLCLARKRWLPVATLKTCPLLMRSKFLPIQ